jgi:hypothetical protein
MNTIHIEPARDKQVLYLVETAVRGEVARLELALELARQRMKLFEQKYHVTSDHFAANMVAEDLEGGDDEYVRWAGEYRLLQRLEAKLGQLKELRFED